MSYLCNYCNYHTLDKSNYSKHLKSKKHLVNESNQVHDKKEDIQENTQLQIYREYKLEDEIKDEKKEIEYNQDKQEKFICKNCNKEYSYNTGYYRHIKKCNKKNKSNNNIKKPPFNLGDLDTYHILLTRYMELEHKLIENENEFKTKITKLESENKDLLDKVIENKDKNNDILYNENMYLKSICNNATYFVSETMNTVNFIISNLTSAPPIDKTIDYNKILYDNYTKEKIDIIDEMVHNYRHKSLVKYIGDMIVKCYKKDDPSEQSIWNSDVSRKNYLLREIINKKPEWITDKKGIKTMEIIIEPILKIVENIIKEFLQQEVMNTDGSINKFLVNKKIDIGIPLNEILLSINHKTLHNDINSYIAQFFYFNKNEYINKNKKTAKTITSKGK